MEYSFNTSSKFDLKHKSNLCIFLRETPKKLGAKISQNKKSLPPSALKGQFRILQKSSLEILLPLLQRLGLKL